MIQDIRIKYLSLLSDPEKLSEADVKEKVVVPILTGYLGFKEEWIEREKKLKNTRKAVDLLIKDKKENVVAIEIKKRVKLNDKDILQLAGYLNIESIRWGILTNGVEWILLNHDIKGNFKDKIVFRINLFSNKIGDDNSQYLLFFNYNNLFETAKTNYYRDIQQFKNYIYKGNNRSWNQYKCALKKLVRFLSETQEIYIELDRLHLIDFINYFTEANNTLVNKGKNKEEINQTINEETIKNAISYLRSFYRISVENKLLYENPLEFISYKDIIKKLEMNVIQKQKITVVSENVITQIYEKINKNKNHVRDIGIFSLLLIGLSRIEITNLKLDDYNGKRLKVRTARYNKLLKDERVFLIPLEVCKRIDEYLLYRKKEEIKSEFLFCKSDGGRLTEEGLSYGIKRAIQGVDLHISVERIQRQVIKQWLLSSRDFISMSYMTGLEIVGISDLLTWDEISRLAKIDEDFFYHHPFRTCI